MCGLAGIFDSQARSDIDRAVLERLFVQHDRGQREWSTPLWSVLMFEAFLQGEVG